MKMIRVKVRSYNVNNEFWVKESNKKKLDFWNDLAKKDNGISIIKERVVRENSVVSEREAK